MLKNILKSWLELCIILLSLALLFATMLLALAVPIALACIYDIYFIFSLFLTIPAGLFIVVLLSHINARYIIK